MARNELAAAVEALASTLVMADPHDLQAVKKTIELFEEIARCCQGELESTLKPAARAAVSLAEEMIVQQGEEAAASLDVLNRTVTALQTVLRDGPQAGLKLLPGELGLDMADSSSPPKAVDDNIFAEFLSAQESVLEEMESCILAIEKEGISGKSAGLLKRLLHTLKGEAGLLDLGDVERVCHETESFLDRPRNENFIDRLLAVKDWLSQKFEACSGKESTPGDVNELLALLNSKPEKAGPEKRTAAKSAKKKKNTKQKKQQEPVLPKEGDANLLCDFISEAQGHLDNAELQLLTIESNPEDQEALNATFRSFHTIKGVAGFLDLRSISELSHAAEDVLDRARKQTLVLSGAAIDTIFETVDTMRRMVGGLQKALASGKPVEPEPGLENLLSRLEEVLEGKAVESPVRQVDPDKKLGEILVEDGLVGQDAVSKALKDSGEQGKLGEKLVKKAGVPAREVAGALRAQQAARKSNETMKIKETVKIDTERLDKLLDAIGEQVIAESMVSQDDEILSAVSARVSRNLGHLHKVTRTVQELGMSMRMVPIRPTFQKMARLVRDLSIKSQKKIQFVTSGEETELDRSVVEQIGDPLIHLIRNSVDHGLEDGEKERLKAGKPATGRIELRAFHRGGSIYIEVSDDGRGLDRELILAKAKERGIIRNGNEMSDREVFNLIFAPGFSTAKKITDVSGRGVGMDVVKRNLETLRGSVELMSETGKGTTVSMRLPLTLAIIDGMIIRVGRERYIIPTLSVMESLRPRPEDLNTVADKGEMLTVRGRLLPLYRLSKLFEIDGAIQNPSEALVIIVEDQGHNVAFLVDSLIGQQQVVIKSLGEGLGKIQGISGGAIMSDGRVGLILDISGLIKLALASRKNEKSIKKEIASDEGKIRKEDSRRLETAVL